MRRKRLSNRAIAASYQNMVTRMRQWDTRNVGGGLEIAELWSGRTPADNPSERTRRQRLREVRPCVQKQGTSPSALLFNLNRSTQPAQRKSGDTVRRDKAQRFGSSARGTLRLDQGCLGAPTRCARDKTTSDPSYRAIGQ